MDRLDENAPIGILGAGTMGTGISQVAATQGHPVILCDLDEAALQRSRNSLEKILIRLVEKGRLDSSDKDSILGRIRFSANDKELKDSALVIEAIVEDLKTKQRAFQNFEKTVGGECLLATNTSSLSITSIASACQRPQRVLGLHFFNPAPLMPLVEVVPGLLTDAGAIKKARALAQGWGKTTVLAKDTPGFIVNRVARPFYGEALRILEENVADAATIDWAMREIGGFRMGPFELMDLIGNDVNLAVTETVFREFFFDPRYKPSITQKRMVEAGLLGRKSGMGYFDYAPEATPPKPVEDRALGEEIFLRILSMLLNEAVDAAFLKIATAEEIDLAMTKGVNYPKGLLRWADEIGLDKTLARLETLQAEYGEDRYRPSPLLRRMVRQQKRFF